MSTRSSARILPMQTAGTQHLIERTYRESGQYQWVREIFVNAIEAEATRIEFGIEWQAVESLNVYRRTISDNGCGMTAAQLVEFFNTFGGGGKPIGGAHENFGVGSKTSLLPWNPYGLVVVSWVDGDASMIWVTRDPETGEYGLKVEPCSGANGETTLEAVYDPYDDPEHGCDWSAIKPDWIDAHGTVIVLLGTSPTSDTVEGDTSRGESDIKGISAYLNRRIWEIDESTQVFVDELRTGERAGWPPNETIAHGQPPKVGKDRRTNLRSILGAQYYIQYPIERPLIGRLEADGCVSLKDGTEVFWYLWNGDRPKVHSYAAIGGYIGALYNNELYDVSSHHSTYRSFGIVESAVRSKLWLVIRPPVDQDGKRGVYPKTDRNSLLLRGGPSAGGPLPIADWAAEFADNMPEEILEALRAARKLSSGAFSDDEWREKLAERFGNRWRLSRHRAKKGGPVSVRPELIRRSKRVTEGSVGSGGAAGGRGSLPRAKGMVTYGAPGGSVEGELITESGALPQYVPVGAAEVGEGMLAAWSPKYPDCPEGAVLINVEHPVMRSVIEHWQSQYSDHHSEDIERDVVEVYGQVAVSKVAHSEHLKGILPAQVVEKELRSEGALTIALLGLMSEDQLISTRVGGKYHKKRKATDRQRERPLPR
jgi:hypothetical protein